MAKTKVDLPKQSTSPNSETNKGAGIKNFSILIDVMNLVAERQESVIKKLETTHKHNSGFKKQNELITKSIDELTKEQKTTSKNVEQLINEQQKSNEIAKQASDASNFAEEIYAEKEKEKIIKEEQFKQKEEKDRAIIISKLTSLEEKDFSVDVSSGSGSGSGLLNLLKNLATLAATAGLLTAGFLGLKNLLDSVLDGSFFSDKDTRTPELVGAVTGASTGLKAGQAAEEKVKKGKEALKKGRGQLKESRTGKRATPEAPKTSAVAEQAASDAKKSTPTRDSKGRFTAKPKPSTTPVPEKMPIMERLGRGTRGGINVAKGAGQIAGGIGTGIKQSVSVGRMGSAAGVGGVLAGATEGILEYGTGGDAKDIAIATGIGAAKGAATAIGFEVAAGLASTAGAAVGGTAGRALTYSVPFLGWGLLIYDLIKTAATSGDMGKNIANSKLLTELNAQMQQAIENSENLIREAEAYKDSDPERYNNMINMANNNIKSNAKAFAQFHNIVETENKLDEIVDMEKWFQVGPFGLWDRGSSYNVNDIDNISKSLQNVPGKTTADQIKIALENSDKYNVPGLKGVVDSLGIEDTAKLLTEGAETINQFRINAAKDPFQYFQDVQQVEPPQMRKGAALIHSASSMGVPVMAGERGNPETIIPLNKFDEVISKYIENKNLSVRLENKSYDGITMAMRDSYLQEKQISQTPPSIVLNNVNNGGGQVASGDPVNFQFQADLNKTFENVFDMLIEKNFRLGTI